VRVHLLQPQWQAGSPLAVCCTWHLVAPEYPLAATRGRYRDTVAHRSDTGDAHLVAPAHRHWRAGAIGALSHNELIALDVKRIHAAAMALHCPKHPLLLTPQLRNLEGCVSEDPEEYGMLHDFLGQMARRDTVAQHTSTEQVDAVNLAWHVRHVAANMASAGHPVCAVRKVSKDTANSRGKQRGVCFDSALQRTDLGDHDVRALASEHLQPARERLQSVVEHVQVSFPLCGFSLSLFCNYR